MKSNFETVRAGLREIISIATRHTALDALADIERNHDRRVTELLEANNALLERARAAEARHEKTTPDVQAALDALRVLAEGVIIRDRKMEEYGVYTGRNESELRLAQEVYDGKFTLAQQQPVTYHDTDYSSPMRPKRLEYTMCGKIYAVQDNGERHMFMDVRGWGYLTGGGAKNLPREEAEAIQDKWANEVVNLWNNASEQQPVNAELLEARTPQITKQTVIGEKGNCYSACLASMLGIAISDVPNFYDAGDTPRKWWDAVKCFLRQFNAQVFVLEGDLRWLIQNSQGFLIVSGKSNRGLDHAVVFKDGTLFFDPHPDDSGITEIIGVDIIAPINPLLPIARADQESRPVMCHADRDGDCEHPNCPQLRDNEPNATGRHCPLDIDQEGDAS